MWAFRTERRRVTTRHLLLNDRPGRIAHRPAVDFEVRPWSGDDSQSPQEPVHLHHVPMLEELPVLPSEDVYGIEGERLSACGVAEPIRRLGAGAGPLGPHVVALCGVPALSMRHRTCGTDH